MKCRICGRPGDPELRYCHGDESRKGKKETLMKSTKIAEERAERMLPDLPFLGSYPDGTVVMFTSLKYSKLKYSNLSGICVHSGGKNSPEISPEIGEYYDYWNMDFEIFNGSIELFND